MCKLNKLQVSLVRPPSAFTHMQVRASESNNTFAGTDTEYFSRSACRRIILSSSFWPSQVRGLTHTCTGVSACVLTDTHSILFVQGNIRVSTNSLHQRSAERTSTLRLQHEYAQATTSTAVGMFPCLEPGSGFRKQTVTGVLHQQDSH